MLQYINFSSITAVAKAETIAARYHLDGRHKDYFDSNKHI